MIPKLVGNDAAWSDVDILFTWYTNEGPYDEYAFSVARQMAMIGMCMRAVHVVPMQRN